MRFSTTFSSALVAALLATAVAAQEPNALSRAASADQRRPASDVALDSTRRGPEVLTCSGIKPGWRVIDLMQGSGYYTRLFIAAAGPRGKVYAWSPTEFIALKQALYGDSLETLTKEYKGRLTPMRSPFETLVLPRSLDLVFTSQNYHDLLLFNAPADRARKLNREIYRALKPGGVYLIVDHAANSGDATAPNRIHRMDPADLRRDVEADGFVFDGECNALRNPADPRTKNVFDPSIRGRTDQIIYRFKKPKSSR